MATQRNATVVFIARRPISVLPNALRVSATGVMKLCAVVLAAETSKPTSIA